MALGNKLDDMARERLKKEKFLRTRMWINTISSYIFPDRGNIFEGIGDNIFISNNQYSTANALSAVIVIEELSTETDATFTTQIMKKVKEKAPGTIVDFTFKNQEYRPDLDSGGLESRMRGWHATLENPLSSKKSKERAARALYSVEICKSGVKIYKTRIYVTIRAKKGSTLKYAVKEVITYLRDMGADVRQIKSDMETHLKYIALLHDLGSEKIRDVGYNVLDLETLARIIPTVQGIHHRKGIMMGINKRNMNPYFLDIKSSSKGKNLGMIGITGFGKTFAIICWLIDLLALKFNLIINDVKGNDYDGLCKLFNGATINLGPNSRRFVNSFRLRPDGVEEPLIYFQERFRMSKEILRIFCDFKPDEEVEGLNILEDFLQRMYMMLGVSPENKNTWYRTDDLHPFKVYDYFLKYCSPDMKRKHGKIMFNMINNLRAYLTRDGSCSVMFREEYIIEDIRDKNIIRFSFDMLQGAGTQDERMLKVKYLFMEFIMNDFVQYKKSLKQWTAVVEEEAQIANDYLLGVYARCNTLWRAMNAFTIMSCNSYDALKMSQHSKALIESMTLICVGVLNKGSRESLIEDFELYEYVNFLDKINSKNPNYNQCFLFVNKMDRYGGGTIIKEYIPEDIVESELYKNVDTKIS